MPNPQQNNSKETKTLRLTHFLHGGSPSLVLQVVQPFFKWDGVYKMPIEVLPPGAGSQVVMATTAPRAKPDELM